MGSRPTLITWREAPEERWSSSTTTQTAASSALNSSATTNRVRADVRSVAAVRARARRAYNGSGCFVPHCSHLTVLPRVSAAIGSARLQRQHVTSLLAVGCRVTAVPAAVVVTAGAAATGVVTTGLLASGRPAIPSERH